MSTAELNKKKLDLIAWINKLSDVSVIEFLEGVKKSKTKKDWFEELTDSQKELIQSGINDFEDNRTITSTDFWNRIKE